MTPEMLARSNTEDGHQRAVMQWAALNRPRFPQLKWLHHIPNGGLRDAITAGKMKALGVKKGIYDLCLPCARRGYHGLYLEMKKPAEKPKREGSKGGRSDEQIEFGIYLDGEGYCWRVCYSWQEATEALEWYMSE